MSLLLWIILIVLVVMYFNINARILDIEEYLVKAGIKKPKGSASPDRLRNESAKEKKREARRSGAKKLVKRGEGLGDALVAWLKNDWMIKLGVFLVIVGVLWFVTYVFLENIGTMFWRTSVSALIGISILAFGLSRMEISKRQGAGFTVFGAAVLLLLFSVSHLFYGLFSSLLTLAIMGAISAFVAFVGVYFNIRWLSSAALFFAGISPIFVGLGGLSFIALFSYLILMVLAVLFIDHCCGFRALVSFAAFLVFVYSFLAVGGEPSKVLLYFTSALGAILLVTSTTQILRQKGKNSAWELFTAATAGAFLLISIIASAPIGWQSIILFIWAVIFGFGTLALYETLGKKVIFYTYGTLVWSFLATLVAVAAQSAILTGLTALALFGVLATYIVAKDEKMSDNASLFFVIPFFFSIFELFEYLYDKTAVFTGELFSVFFFIIGVFLTGMFLHRMRRKESRKKDGNTEQVLLLLSAGLAYVLYWSFFAKFLAGHASLTIAITALNVLVVLGAYWATKNISWSRHFSAFLVIPFFFTLPHFFLYATSFSVGILGVFGMHFFALFFYPALLLCLGIFFRQHQGKHKRENTLLSNAFIIVSALYGLALLWLVFHRVLQSADLAVMFSLISYVVFGIGAYFIGLVEKKRLVRDCGTVLLLFVIVRLLTVDVWEMAVTTRTITFFAIGILFLGTTFLTRRKQIMENKE